MTTMTVFPSPGDAQPTSRCRKGVWMVLALALVACDDDPPQGAGDVSGETGGEDGGADLADAPGEDTADDTPADAEVVIPEPFADIPEVARWSLPCLTAPVHVIETEVGHPHLYAESDHDLQCAQGFIVARDRFAVMELARRLGLTRLSEVLGDVGLDLDISNRSWGMARMADGLLQGIQSGDFADEVEAYAAGVNAYIALVRAGELPPPPLFDLAFFLLGARAPEDLLVDWDVAAVAGAGAALLWQSSFDGDDVALQNAVDALEEWGDGLPEAERRREGLRLDVLLWLRPAHAEISAADWSYPGPEGLSLAVESPLRNALWPRGLSVEQGALERARARLDEMAARTGRANRASFGSNAWAVAPEEAGGETLLASDGHLTLTTPTTFYSMHLDTALLGDGETHVAGLTVPGIPLVVLGTNGDVAWSQTQFLGDVIDWYREEVILQDGVPVATRFGDEERPLRVIEETYDVSRALGSTAGTRTIARYETEDGRPLFSLEGTAVEDPDEVEGAINIAGDWIVPGDVDEDGLVTGISVAYAGHFERHGLDVYRGFGHSASLQELMQHHARSAALGANIHAADDEGHLLYSGYQAMPCRRYLARDEAGIPLPGANPMLLIDGTTYASFEVTRESDGRIAPASDDDQRCMLSYAQFPHSEDPAQGFVFNGNNDPQGATFDNNVWNDPVYVGGPGWDVGYRAWQIHEGLSEGTRDLARMQALQSDHHAALARDFWPWLEAALSAARQADEDGETEGAAGRMAALYATRSEEIDEAYARLAAWSERGYPAASGVETFYHVVGEDEADDAVATMIFQAWFAELTEAVFADEGVPSEVNVYGNIARTLYFLYVGRDADNSEGLASWSPDTEESVFFDDLDTEEVETSDELSLLVLVATLDALAGADEGDGAGGFGTTNQDGWLWGLKHMVRFPSIVAAYLGDDSSFGAVLSGLSITTDTLPLTIEELGDDDPRASLTGFPRPGAPYSIDVGGRPAAFGDFSYTHGPVMRFSVALSADGATGRNIVPGGQSDNDESAHYADQARMWLGNEGYPLLLEAADVADHAVQRELLLPVE